MHIDAAETQRHRVHSVCGPGSGAQAKAAIEQRVVVQEPVKGPLPLVIAAASKIHPGRRRHRPVRDGKFRLPVMVVGQLEQIGPNQRNQRHRPRPIVLLQIQQRALRMRPLGYRAYRQRRQIENCLVIHRQQGAEGVRAFGCRENFVFGVLRIKNVRCIDIHRRSGEIAFEVFIAPAGWNVGVRRPVNQRESNIDVFGRHHVRQITRIAMHSFGTSTPR